MNDTATPATTDNRQLRLGLMLAAWLSLAAGLFMGLLALAGPVAVWLGLTNFQMGFGLLQIVNAWANWVAGITLLLAIAIFFAARARNIGSGQRLAGLALVGTIIAGLSWYVPETFRPPEGTPPIHDIATDPDDPLDYIAIASLRAEAPNNMDYGIMANDDAMTPENHRRLQREAYPDIVPQRFDASVGEVYERALAAAESLGWEIVSADPGAARIEATDTTFWFRFKDDVVIEITPDGNGAVLNARSLSRVGRSDVGKNAARLREFFALL